MSEAVERREALDRLAQAAKDYAGIDDPDSMEAVDEDYRLVGRAIDEAASSAQVVPQPNREVLDDGARVDLEIEMERHQPILSMEDGSIHGCQCMDRVFYRKHESWGSHLADVALDAVLSALSPAPLTIDREALAKTIFSYRYQTYHWVETKEWERNYYLGWADAVIVHLSAQPVEGEVEWAVQFANAGGTHVEPCGSREEAERLQAASQASYPFPEEIVLVRRTVGPWIEVQP